MISFIRTFTTIKGLLLVIITMLIMSGFAFSMLETIIDSLWLYELSVSMKGFYYSNWWAIPVNILIIAPICNMYIFPFRKNMNIEKKNDV